MDHVTHLVTTDHGRTSSVIHPARWTTRRGGTARLLDTLPRRARVRLWAARRVNSAGIWLVEHEHFGMAKALWRIRA